MKNKIKMAYYVDFVNQFFKTGRIPPLSIAISSNNPFRDSDDSIIDYLRNHFSKMELFKEAFSDPLHKAAYRNAIISFISELLRELEFNEDVEGTIKRQSQKIEYVYRNRLLIVKKAIDEGQISSKDLDRLIDGLGDGINDKGIKETIELLNSRKKNHALEEILLLIGRKPSNAGDRKAHLSYGNQNLPHSGGSDIQGITVGQSFSSLLPFETALFSDSQTEDVFLHKYVDHQLQLFHHKSENGKSSRGLNNVRAKGRGPMIICMDTSGSMEGHPLNVARVVVSNIFMEAQRQKRACLLILYSEDIDVIDLKNAWENYKVRLGGGYKDFILQIPIEYGATDITDMLLEIFDSWENSQGYQLADVLVISDFEIPKPSIDLLSKMMYYRGLGYRFFGYKIGAEETELSPYFNNIVQHEAIYGK
jgi:uncharacterized protein with von Willebrand factor type A (vWA) domain